MMMRTRFEGLFDVCESKRHASEQGRNGHFKRSIIDS